MLSLKEIAKLMNSHRRVRVTGKKDEVPTTEPHPLWTPEQFLESFNSLLDRAKVDRLTIEQAREFLHKDGDPFSTKQYEVFKMWVDIRLGETSVGVTFAAPNPPIKMGDIIASPVILPEETGVSDRVSPFVDETNRRQRERMELDASRVGTGHPDLHPETNDMNRIGAQ